MKLTYIFHSGFALEAESCILIFDYWMDFAGVIPPLLRTSKPIYVFSSHFHEDHFTSAIFSWRTEHSPVTYILSKDILKHHRAKKEDADVWLAKGGCWQDENVKIKATGSTDSGVSWVVEIENKIIFHAGDLNNWYARYLSCESHLEVPMSECGKSIDPVKEDKRYLGELKDIQKVTSHFDLVMFPVDGRIGNGYTRGARQFIERFRVGMFVPMHFVASGFESSWRMKEFTDPRQINFWKIQEMGESIEI